MNPSRITKSQTLNSWKEIAQYLDRGVRTVQRWEDELDLPVRRLGKSKRSPVYAVISELKFWVATVGVLPPNSKSPAKARREELHDGTRPHLNNLAESRRLMSTMHQLAQELASASVRQRQQAELLAKRLAEMRARLK